MNNEQPSMSGVTHTIDLSKFPGKQKLIAIWNIGDTSNAFYSCVDLNVGGSSGGSTSTTTTAPPRTEPQSCGRVGSDPTGQLATPTVSRVKDSTRCCALAGSVTHSR